MQLKIIPNMVSKEGRVTLDLSWEASKTIQDYLNESSVDIPDFKVIVSGKVETDLTKTIRPSDEIIVTPKVEIIEGLIAFFVWLGVSTTVATILAYAIVIAIMVASVLMTTLSKPRRPSFGATAATPGSLDASSPTYGWDGVQTTQNVGTPVPVVYGEHLVGGNIINEYISNDGDKNYLHVLLALCEGEISSIGSIQINDNDIANFESVVTDYRLGTNDQTPIEGFELLHNLTSVSVNLNDVSDAHTYTTADTEVEGFIVLITLPSGLFAMNTTTGATVAWEVQFKIEYKLHSSGTWLDYGTQTISGTNRSAVRRTYTVSGLAAGQYDIRLTRMSAGGDGVHIGDMTWSQVDELKTENLAYPNTALLAFDFLATDQLSGSTPNLTSIVKGKKVSAPNVLTELGGTAVAYDDYYYDPATDLFKKFSDDSSLYWDGTTYADAYSANPIWCIKDLLTNTRFGLGNYIDTSHIDSAMFLEMAEYCDGKVSDGEGGYEKRFRLDVVLDSATRALDALVQLAGTFRGTFFFSEDFIKVKIDKPEDPVQLFTMGNIIADSFTQAWKSVKESFNMVEVQFLNKDMNYQQDIISFIDEAALAAGAVLRKSTIRLFCTRTSQALREARHLMNYSKFINQSVGFKVSIDAIAMQVGDVINIAHDVPQWGLSGRVVSSSSSPSNTVTIDQPVTILAGHTYQLQIRHSDDTLEIKTVTSEPGTTSVLGVGTGFSFTPSAFDVYAFGEVDVSIKPFRVMSLTRDKNHEIDVVAIEYNEDIYDDSGPVIPALPGNTLDHSVSDVQNLAITEELIAVAGGFAQSIAVWFTTPNDSGKEIGYRWTQSKIYYSIDGGNSWVLSGVASGTGYHIQGVSPGGAYTVKVVSISANGMETALSTAPSASITLSEPSGTGGGIPGNVSGFAYTFTGSHIVFNWDPLSATPQGYEIRKADSSWGTINSDLVYRGQVTQTTIIAEARSGITYYIRAFNASNYSTASASVTPSNETPSAVSALGADVIFSTARLFWTVTGTTDVINYEIWKSETNAWGGEETLYSTVTDKQGFIEGKTARSTVVGSGTSETVFTCPNLIGLDTDYFVGDQIRFTSGANAGQVGTITAFDGATGQITVGSAFTDIPTAGDQVVINDVIYVKVRAVDNFGYWSLSSAYQIIFSSITSDMLGDSVVNARNINVGCLSAISANMGLLTAGTLQGATVQTGSGGQRLLMDATGIYGYDSSCCQKLQICNDGSIVAQSAKFQDPACVCNYSYVNAGALTFHDVCGDVPYVKRICSGSIASGSWVCLYGWTTAPEVMAGIKALNSFDSTFSAQTQSWCVYVDGIQAFDVAGCYGYKFQVHAALTLATGQGAPVSKAVGFEVTACTATCVCQTDVCLNFQAWCNNAAPSNFYYGTICYALCYRKVGDTTYCACCYWFTQPHASQGQIQSTVGVVNALCFPCMAQWEICAHQVSASYTDSGICATTTVVNCYSCTINGTAALWNVSGASLGVDYTVTCCISFAGYPTGTVFCTMTYWCFCNTGDAVNCSWVLSAKTGGTYDPTYAYPAGCITYCGGSKYISAYTGNSGTWCYINGTYSYAGTSCLPSFPFSMYVSRCGWGTGRNCTYSKVLVCVAAICQIVCYSCTCYSGASACCLFECVHTFADTYGCYCVLDPAGQLNWLAIAYT